MSERPTNLLLESLSDTDRKLLQPHLRRLQLQQGQILIEAEHSVSNVYFPYNAIVSLVVTLSTGDAIEAAMVGRDGVIGAWAAFDGDISLTRAVVQIGGDAVACDVNALKQAVTQSATLSSLLIRHEQVVYAQAQQSAACNAKHSLEERLARWLLRARDLTRSNMLPFTQEFLAEILGARRTSVTVIARTLQQAGLLKYSRGRIQIVDPEGLLESACECYDTIRRRHDVFLGVLNNK